MKIWRRDDSGAVAVEFAMVSVLFITTMLAVVEVGRAFWTYNTLQYALEQTARYYLTHTSTSNSDLTTYALGQMGEVSTAPLTVTVSKSTVSGIHVVEIDGSYSYSVITPLMTSAWSHIVLSAQTRLPSPN